MLPILRRRGLVITVGLRLDKATAMRQKELAEFSPTLQLSDEASTDVCVGSRVDMLTAFILVSCFLPRCCCSSLSENSCRRSI